MKAPAVKVPFPLLNPEPGGPLTVEIDPAAIHQVSPLGRSACRVFHGTGGAEPVWTEVKVGWMSVLAAPTLRPTTKVSA
jgi:hypothetical protein